MLRIMNVRWVNDIANASFAAMEMLTTNIYERRDEGTRSSEFIALDVHIYKVNGAVQL